MYLGTLSVRVCRVILLLLVGLGLAFYLILGLGVKSLASQQLLQQEQTVARAEANNVESFFRILGDSVAILARLSNVEKLDKETIHDMDTFVEQWRKSGILGGVILVNKYGVVHFNSNILGTRDIGVSLADRDYFLWAKNKSNEKEYFIGQPAVSRVGASKGKITVPVAAAIYQNAAFAGVMAASVQLAPLTQNYLEFIKISDLTKVYLVKNDGELLYSNSTQDIVGSSIFEIFPKLGSVLNTNKEGKLQTLYLDPILGKSKKYLVAYSPILLGDQNWFVVIASPVESAENLATPIYIRIIIMMLLISCTIVVFGVVTTKETQNKLK